MNWEKKPIKHCGKNERGKRNIQNSTNHKNSKTEHIYVVQINGERTHINTMASMNREKEQKKTV